MNSYVTPCPVGTIRQVQGLDPINNPYIDCISSNSTNNSYTMLTLRPDQMILDQCKFDSSYTMNTDLTTGEYKCYAKAGNEVSRGNINISFAPVQESSLVGNNSCPENAVVSKQTIGEVTNTLSCYDANGIIIGSPINNEAEKPSLCKIDSPIDNYLTHISSEYIQCNVGDSVEETTNTCPDGYMIAVKPNLKLNGELSYTCRRNTKLNTFNNQPFTCPFNVTPIQTHDPRLGTLYKCILPSSESLPSSELLPAPFTNVNGFKSKKERKVESFSQNTNGKCKVRY
jgi:hypothetical protein